MPQSWIVLLPPFVVVISSLISRKLLPSLILGLFSGVYIAQQYRLMPALKLLSCRIYEQIFSIEAIAVYTFMFGVGILISLINYTGAAKAFAKKLKQRISTKKGAELATVYFLVILSLDDYLNCLTAGYIMRPIADGLSIAREKLAYILHSFAGPLVLIVPISTWATFITSQLDLAGISNELHACTKIIADPFAIYLQSIPYIFYTFFGMITALIIILKSYSFGPMSKHEQQVCPITDEQLEVATDLLKTTPFDLILPLATLVSSIILGLLYTGNFWLFGGTHNFMTALQSTDKAFQVLGLSSILAIIISFTHAISKRQITTSKVLPIIHEGLWLMIPVICLIFIASTLGIILRVDLRTGEYVASLLLNTVQISYLPLFFFIISALIASMIGTAWGTITLLVPIGIPMLHTLMGATSAMCAQDMPLLMPLIGAMLAGSTFGDHTSPVSAASIMAATSARCNLFKHVITQYPYAIAPFIGSCISYGILGYCMHMAYTAQSSYIASGLAGIATVLAILYAQKCLTTPASAELLTKNEFNPIIEL